MINLRKIKISEKNKKFAAKLAIVFAVIVALLTGSSLYLNRDKVTKYSSNVDLQSLSISDEDQEKHAVTEDNGEDLSNFASALAGATEEDGTRVIVSSSSYSSSSKNGTIATDNTDSSVDSVSTVHDQIMATAEKTNATVVYYKDYYVLQYTDTVSADAGYKDLSEPSEVLAVNTVQDSILQIVDDPTLSIQGDGGETVVDENVNIVTSEHPQADARAAGKVLVALIDTGANNSDSFVDFTGSGAADKNGHGTSMSTIIKEKSGNKAYILSLKAMDDDGTGKMSNVSAAVRYAIDAGADIINLSIAAYDNGQMEPLRALLAEASEKGIKVVAAAGNYSDDVANYVPANSEGTVSVGAADDEGVLQSFSNFGDTLSMVVKNANSTSNAAATVSGYIASGKDLSECEDVLTEWTRVSKASGSSTSNKDGKFKTEWGSSKVYFKTDGHGSMIVSQFHKNYPYTAGAHSTASDSTYQVIDGGYGNNEDAAIHIISLQGNSGYHGVGFTISGTFVTKYKGYQVGNWIERNGTYSVSEAGTSVGYHSSWGWWDDIEIAAFWPAANSKTYITGNFAANTYPLILKANGGKFSYTNSDTWTSDANNNGASLVYDGGNYGNMKIDNAERSARAQRTPTRTGYKFLGFYRSATGGDQVFDSSMNPVVGQYWTSKNSSDYCNMIYDFGGTGTKVTLYAHWEKADYTVKYNSNGGTGSMSDQTISYDVSTNLSANSFSKTGYNFAGWATSPNGSVVYSNKQAVKNIAQAGGSITLYAKWTPKEYELYINPNGGTIGGSGNNASPTSGTNPNLVYNSGNWNNIAGYTATRNGYTLNGYYTSASGGIKVYNADGKCANDGTYFKNNVYVHDGSLTVYAQWTGLPYNINFDANSYRGQTTPVNTPSDSQTRTASGSMNSISAVFGTDKTLPAIGYIWEGHKFTGWNTKADGTGTSYSDKATSKWFGNSGGYPTSSGQTVTLYAQWSLLSTTVIVDPNKGRWNNSSSTSQRTSNWGTTLQLDTPTPPTWTTTINYDLNGDGALWAGTQPTGVSSSATVNNQDVISVAFNYWQIQDSSGNNQMTNYSYGFIRDGTAANKTNVYVFGANSAIIQAQYYFNTIVLPKPEREGYTFLGWYYDTDLTQKIGNAGTTFRTAYATDSVTYTAYARWIKNNFNYSDMLDYRMTDDTIEESSSDPEVYIGKFDENGNILTTVDTDYTAYDHAEIQISSGSTFNTSNVVITLNTKRGILDNAGALVQSTSDRSSATGYYDVSSLLAVGTYTARETLTPAGYLPMGDQTFTVANNSRNNITFTNETMNLQLYKITSSGNAYIPLAGVKFDLYDGNTKISSDTTDGNGKLTNTLKNLVAGRYMTLKETSVPAGYSSGSYAFTVPKNKLEESALKNGGFVKYIHPCTGYIVHYEGTALGLVNDHNYVNLRIRKEDSDGNVLRGTKFRLYVLQDGELYEAHYKTVNNVRYLVSPDSSEYDTYANNLYDATIGIDGYATFNQLPPKALSDGTNADAYEVDFLAQVKDANGNMVNDTASETDWFIQEVDAVDGYSLLANPVKVTLPDENNATYTVKIIDDKVIEVLNTGGYGSIQYTAFGSLIIAMALLLVLKQKYDIKSTTRS